MLKALGIYILLIVLSTALAIISDGYLLEFWCLAAISCLGGMGAQCYIFLEKNK